MEAPRDHSYYGNLQIASDEQVERLEQAKVSAYQSDLALLDRVTYKGRANPKRVKRNRKRNKLARRQRRVNRLRSKSQSATPSRFPRITRQNPRSVPQIQKSKRK